MLTRLVAVAFLVVTTTTAGATLAHATSHRLVCTHGASSVGPVVFVHGRLAGPAPAPATEACLP